MYVDVHHSNACRQPPQLPHAHAHPPRLHPSLLKVEYTHNWCNDPVHDDSTVWLKVPFWEALEPCRCQRSCAVCTFCKPRVCSWSTDQRVVLKTDRVSHIAVLWYHRVHAVPYYDHDTHIIVCYVCNKYVIVRMYIRCTFIVCMYVRTSANTQAIGGRGIVVALTLETLLETLLETTDISWSGVVCV